MTNGDREGQIFYPILTQIMDSFSCSPLIPHFLLEKHENVFQKILSMLKCDIHVAWWHHLNITMTSLIDMRASMWLFFFIFSTELVQGMRDMVNGIHHWCPVGTEKSQPEGPPFQWETRLADFPLNSGPRVGIFLETLDTNDRFFFSYTGP